MSELTERLRGWRPPLAAGALMMPSGWRSRLTQRAMEEDAAMRLAATVGPDRMLMEMAFAEVNRRTELFGGSKLDAIDSVTTDVAKGYLR